MKLLKLISLVVVIFSFFGCKYQEALCPEVTGPFVDYLSKKINSEFILTSYETDRFSPDVPVKKDVYRLVIRKLASGQYIFKQLLSSAEKSDSWLDLASGTPASICSINGKEIIEFKTNLLGKTSYILLQVTEDIDNNNLHKLKLMDFRKTDLDALKIPYSEGGYAGVIHINNAGYDRQLFFDIAVASKDSYYTFEAKK